MEGYGLKRDVFVNDDEEFKNNVKYSSKRLIAGKWQNRLSSKRTDICEVLYDWHAARGRTHHLDVPLIYNKH
jgi:hypothetical protein